MKEHTAGGKLFYRAHLLVFRSELWQTDSSLICSNIVRQLNLFQKQRSGFIKQSLLCVLFTTAHSL